MKSTPHRLCTNRGEPTIDQGTENGWFLSWNPDDGRFYVSEEPIGWNARMFHEFRNAVQYARTHQPKI